MFYLKTLGQLCLRSSGPEGQPLLSNSKPLALVAVLATMPEHRARRDYVAGLLWQTSDASHARRSLRQALHYLSRRIDEPLIEATDSLLKLRAELLEVDLWEFERAVEAGEYERVVELYTGPFLPGLERKAGPELEHWIESQDAQLRAGLEAACTRLIGDALENGDAATAVAYAREYVQLNPLNEKAQLALVHSLKAAGDRVGALQAYRSHRTLLKQALDGEPSEELERAISGVRAEVMEEPRFRFAGRPLHRRSRRQMMRWSVTSAAAGAALAALVIAAVLLAWRPWRNPDGLLAGLSGEFLVTAGRQVGEDLVRVRYRGADFDLESTGLGRLDVPSPDGSLVATRMAVDAGWNLAVMDVATGKTRMLTDASHDEQPQDWSPDGRYILYRQGVPSGDLRDYTYRVMSFDLQSEGVRQLADVRSGGGYDAAWSPDGTRVAFVARPEDDGEVFVVNVDGSDLVNVSASDGWDQFPVWSPTGQRLAFVSHRGGGGDLYTVRPDGSDLHRITDAPTEETSPLWLTDRVVAFVMVQPDGSRDLWAVDVNSGELQQLSHRGDIRHISSARLNAEPSWIERLSITPAPEVVSPGQYLHFDVTATAATGRLVESAVLPISWSVSDSAVASFARPGELRVLGSGRTTVVASAGGWVADTLEIVSRELVPGPVNLLLFEDWTRGLREARWIPFGSPSPYTRGTGGPEGAGVFVSNGDEHYPSGIVSRQAFSARAGLTVEVWGRMPFTGQLYQEFGIGLTDGELPPDFGDYLAYTPTVAFWFGGPNASKPNGVAVVIDQNPQILIPLPEAVESWHRYAVQLDPDGTVRLLIDGRLYWQAPARLKMEELGSLRVVLGNRTLGTEIAHGVLRVYYGRRYVIPPS